MNRDDICKVYETAANIRETINMDVSDCVAQALFIHNAEVARDKSETLEDILAALEEVEPPQAYNPVSRGILSGDARQAVPNQYTIPLGNSKKSEYEVLLAQADTIVDYMCQAQLSVPPEVYDAVCAIQLAADTKKLQVPPITKSPPLPSVRGKSFAAISGNNTTDKKLINPPWKRKS